MVPRKIAAPRALEIIEKSMTQDIEGRTVSSPLTRRRHRNWAVHLDCSGPLQPSSRLTGISNGRLLCPERDIHIFAKARARDIEPDSGQNLQRRHVATFSLEVGSLILAETNQRHANRGTFNHPCLVTPRFENRAAAAIGSSTFRFAPPRIEFVATSPAATRLPACRVPCLDKPIANEIGFGRHAAP